MENLLVEAFESRSLSNLKGLSVIGWFFDLFICIYFSGTCICGVALMFLTDMKSRSWWSKQVALRSSKPNASSPMRIVACTSVAFHSYII